MRDSESGWVRMWCEQIDATRGHQYELVIKLEFMTPYIKVIARVEKN